MKKILVTGANGQLGQCIQKIAGQYPEIKFDFKSSNELEITDKKALLNAFDQGLYEYCINCAAYTDVDQAEKEPKRAFAVNAEGVKNLAEACKKNNTILIHISTDYVFDGEKNKPYTVDDIPNPINEYGKSKLRGEQYIQEIIDKYFIIRTSWLYSEFGENFYKTILEKAKTEEVLFVTDEQTGSPTNANNLATFILDIIITDNNKYGIYHFTDNKPMTWYAFAKKIVKENNLECLVKARKYGTFAQRPSYSVLKRN